MHRGDDTKYSIIKPLAGHVPYFRLNIVLT